MYAGRFVQSIPQNHAANDAIFWSAGSGLALKLTLGGQSSLSCFPSSAGKINHAKATTTAGESMGYGNQWGGLTVDFINLFRTAAARKIAAQQVLFKEGDSGNEMFVLLKGAANIIVGSAIVEVARPGTILGEMALIDEDKRSATVITRTPCDLVTLSKDDFDRLIHERPDFARYVLKTVARRLRHMNQGFVAVMDPMAEDGQMHKDILADGGEAAKD